MKNLSADILLMILAILVLSAGCDKSGTNCFSSTGSVIRQERTLPQFDSITMNDNVNVILTYDSISGVAVEAGKNIIDGISTEVVDRNLIISNNNLCNWARSYEKPINIYISVNYLWKVYYNSSGDLRSTNSLPFDSLKVEVWGGCGTIDLNLDVFTGYFIENLGTADFVLSGDCGICYIYSGEYGPFHCEELNMAYCFVTTIGSNDCWVNASRTLGATIGGIGNVYYTGNPDSVYSTITGEGKLIHY
jgi:hypothetical protein